MKYSERVNWYDGQKINKNTFIDLENSIISYLSEIHKHFVKLNGFGLSEAPVLVKENNFYALKRAIGISEVGSYFRLTEEIFESQSANLKLPIGSEPFDRYMVLFSNHDIRQAFGEYIDKRPVQSSSSISYKLEFIKDIDLVSNNNFSGLVVAKIQRGSEDVRTYESEFTYFPPFLLVKNFEPLRKRVDRLQNELELIKNTIEETFQHKIQTNKDGNALSTKNVFPLSLLNFLYSHMGFIENMQEYNFEKIHEFMISLMQLTLNYSKLLKNTSGEINNFEKIIVTMSKNVNNFKFKPYEVEELIKSYIDNLGTLKSLMENLKFFETFAVIVPNKPGNMEDKNKMPPNGILEIIKG